MTLVLAPLASAVITLSLFSDGMGKSAGQNPASHAETVYGNLMSQITAPGRVANSLLTWEPLGASAVQNKERPAELSRNIFTPPRKKSPVRVSGPVTPSLDSRPKLPRLSGILIDGATRKAMVGGVLVSQGDYISGYTVVEIGVRSVVLERNGAQYTLQVGDRQ
jgi:hypothetical protein